MSSKKGYKDRDLEATTSESKIVLEHSSFSGPLPPPSILMAYKQIDENAVGIIFEAFQRQMNHRLEIERGKLKNERLGLIFAFVVAIVGLIVTGYLGYVGASWTAAVLGVIDIGSLVYAFIYGSKVKREERKMEMELLARQASSQSKQT